jgi:hypothetical protein
MRLQRLLSRRRFGLWGSLLVVSLAVVGGVAYASVPDSQGVIHGCRNLQSGIVKISETGECTSAEAAFDWVQSAGYEVYRVTPVEVTADAPSPGTHVLTLTLPPGAYQLSSTIEASKADANAILRCAVFTSTTNAVTFHVASVGVDPGYVQDVSSSATGLETLASGGTAELSCYRLDSSGTNPVVKLADITAVRIGAVTQSEGT